MHRSLTALAIMVVLLGCGGSDGPTATNAAVGVYQLETVNGGALPAYWAASGQNQEVQIISGTLTLRSDGSFSGTRVFRIIGPGAPPGDAFEPSHGSFTSTGSRITLTFRGDTEAVIETIDADLQGQVLTMTRDGRSHVYRR